MMTTLNRILAVVAALESAVAAVSIAEINGNKFLSSYNGQTLTNITGLVTAKGDSGIWVRSLTPDNDTRTSESITVYSSAAAISNRTVGDIISFDAKVTEYRSASYPTYLYLTELGSPKNVKVLSTGNVVKPLVIGVDTPNPPTVQYTSLDNGDIYGLPGGQANISTVNPVLDPTTYGLDFWESLSGELVTVKSPRIIGRPNSYRETWVVGDWPVTGQSEHGSLTMWDKDSNPETVIIGSPLDGTKNPTQSKIGDLTEDITGIVYYQFGFYYILPQTAIKITKNATAEPPATSLVSQGTCRAITVGDYNVENFSPRSPTHVREVAAQIVNYLKTPDLLFLQEIQDNNGNTDDGTVSANVTLANLITQIATYSNVTYKSLSIDPVNDQDGGEPGGNIRVAYLYRPEVLSLWNPNPGSSTDANEVLPGPALKYNPGRIEPDNIAWNVTRKPIAAAWKAKGAKKPFFTVNVHFSSKGGSSPLQGDVRPPLNGVVNPRIAQANVTGTFVAQILAQDPAARVITAGDFNEFDFVQPMETFASVSGTRDLEEVIGLPTAERYTYTYDMNTQALDHMYVSPALERKAQYEHVHVNSWANASAVVSDHDPSVALLNVCGCA